MQKSTTVAFYLHVPSHFEKEKLVSGITFVPRRRLIVYSSRFVYSFCTAVRWKRANSGLPANFLFVWNRPCTCSAAPRFSSLFSQTYYDNKRQSVTPALPCKCPGTAGGFGRLWIFDMSSQISCSSFNPNTAQEEKEFFHSDWKNPTATPKSVLPT